MHGSDSAVKATMPVSATLPPTIWLKTWSFHLVYLSRILLNESGRERFDEMEQRNFEKEQKFQVLNDKYVGFFVCSSLIPEQILYN